MRPQSPTLNFSSLSVSFFIHSTEDEGRVVGSVFKALDLPKESIEIESLEGYFGNTLKLAKSHITGESATSISQSILSKLDSRSRALVASELTSRMDEHDALYIRIDRQLLLGQEGELVLGDEEPVRVKLKPKHRFGGRDAMMEAYRKLLK
jgi:RNA binding exosome subunit